MILYGLKQCDTCRKALKMLDERAEFQTIDNPAPSADMLAEWAEAVGIDALLNNRSTTWRNLSDQDKSLAGTLDGALRLLHENPKLIKRPVIVGEGLITVGWDKNTQSKYVHTA